MEWTSFKDDSAFQNKECSTNAEYKIMDDGLLSVPPKIKEVKWQVNLKLK
jgi:hypothetical protein